MSLLSVRDLRVEFGTHGGVVHAVRGRTSAMLQRWSSSGRRPTAGITPCPGSGPIGRARLDGQPEGVARRSRRP